jgi:hypothetical protein
MASDEVSPIDAAQVEKAVNALLKYVGKQKLDSKNLLDDDDLLYLVSFLRNRMHAARDSSHLRGLATHVQACHQDLNAGKSF